MLCMVHRFEGIHGIGEVKRSQSIWPRIALTLSSFSVYGELVCPRAHGCLRLHTGRAAGAKSDHWGVGGRRRDQRLDRALRLLSHAGFKSTVVVFLVLFRFVVGKVSSARMVVVKAGGTPTRLTPHANADPLGLNSLYLFNTRSIVYMSI
jgi:hypothetical protein